MPSDDPLAGSNLPFVEALYASFLEDPTSVEEDWRRYFEGWASEDGDAWAARRSVDGPSFSASSIFDPPSEAPPSGALPAGAPAASAPAAGAPPVAAAVGPVSVGAATSVTAALASPPVAVTGKTAERVKFLQDLKLFRGLPPEEVAAVALLAVEERFSGGQVLFREADEGTSLYLLIEGELLVRRKDQIVAMLQAGEVFGELSVLDSQPRSADVVARGDVKTLSIDRFDLLGLLERRPVLNRGFLQMLTSRLRERSSRQDKVNRLIHAYRVRGHLLASLDPLGRTRTSSPELELEHWGLSENDLDSLFSSTTIAGTTVLTLRDILALLKAVYCSSIGVQFMHIDDVHAKNWLINRVEDSEHHRRLDRDEKLRILTKLTDAELFEQFIHKKFLGAKRFSLEGAETLIPLLDLALEEAAGQGVDEVVLGMAHRGRLNVLVNIMGKSPRDVFREFADDDPDLMIGGGDVKYHLGFSSDRELEGGRKMHLSLCFNPSHLEFVNPVLQGRVRAKQERFGDTEHRRCLGILVHGDAAFAGQGVIQELFNMANLPGYRTGGTLHVIVNNQIGFTTSPEMGRSTQYATDVARMIQTPVFHVNGEDPDAVAHVVRIAMDYRREFQQDVIIDMYCYRRYGHNEGDEPSYTQPLLYEVIRNRKTVRESYLEHMLELGGVDREEAEKIREERTRDLENELSKSQETQDELTYTMMVKTGGGLWRGYVGGADAKVPEVATGMNRERLAKLLRKSADIPEDFNVHRKLRRFFGNRQKMAAGEMPLDWGAAEAAALASLAAEGARVRFSGQDSGRGTFSHRHAVLYDFETGALHVPLQHLAEVQAEVHVWDSPLSEVSVVGFEYGYSMDTPDGLCLWEAQFGDFSNCAQVIIDQFITSGEDKWRRLSGMVMLLPHGFEGQGPEHSSARLERYLNLTAEDNIQVVNLTTPAQYFHCLRRQVLRPWRKPLIVMSPKSLLRHPRAVSTIDELAGGSFQRVIPDAEVEPAGVKRVLVTSGKVYYDLEKERRESERRDVAIVRLEQYYPLSEDSLESALAPYADDTPVFWVQEEPRNMGAWSFLLLRLGRRPFGRWPLDCVTRSPSASPATGSAAAHKKEQKELIERALG
ncbi:MAG: 2-oxoglutarate dehydrogenase E1 component [bacterium]|nr:2-oxoglutarate dehydrogenase E1 component [bacterium]